MTDHFDRETVFQACVERVFRSCGWTCVYHTQNSRRSDEGFPDVVALRAGRCVIAELKMPGGRVAPAQRLWLETWQTIPSIEVYLWYPKDLNTIEAVASGHGDYPQVALPERVIEIKPVSLDQVNEKIRAGKPITREEFRAVTGS